MLLESFDKANKVGFKKINKMLKENYGITLSSRISATKLHETTMIIKESITELKLSGHNAHKSRELSRNLLILQGLNELTLNRRVFENYSMTGPYSKVVRWLADYIAKNAELGDDFMEAVAQAMREYRSSKWRFPDGQIRQDAINLAVADLKGRDEQYMMAESAGTNESAWDQVLDKSGRGIAGPDANKGNFDFPSDWELDPIDGEEKEMKMDPEMLKRVIAFNKKRMSQKKAEEMKENYVKRLRALLESEVDEAEAIVGARGLSQEVQEMIQKVGRIQNEKLPPLTDQVRDTYGEVPATNFQQGAYQSFQGVIEALYAAKDTIDDSVGNLSQGGGGDVQMDMDAEMPGGADISASVEGDGDELAGAVDDLGDDGLGLDAELDGLDEFGSAEEEDPLGRAALESAKRDTMKAKISEMESMVRRLKESSKKGRKVKVG